MNCSGNQEEYVLAELISWTCIDGKGDSMAGMQFFVDRIHVNNSEWESVWCVV